MINNMNSSAYSVCWAIRNMKKDKAMIREIGERFEFARGEPDYDVEGKSALYDKTTDLFYPQIALLFIDGDEYLLFDNFVHSIVFALKVVDKIQFDKIYVIDMKAKPIKS